MTHVSYSASSEKNDPVQLLISKILSDFSRDYNLDLSQDSIAVERIREAVEKARLELDTAYQTEINLPYISANASGPIHLIRVVTREDMNQQILKSEGPREGQVQSHQPPRIKLPDRKPFVTYSLMGITIVIYLLQLLTQPPVGFDLPTKFGLKINELIVAGQTWRLITPMFLHGSPLHLGFNMYALFILGRRVERFFGSFRFLGLYVIAGITGNVFSFFFTPSHSLGSSTAILGILGAEGIFIYQNRNLFGDKFRVALRQIIQVAAVNLLIGLSSGIDNWGHVGGLIGGVAYTWFAGPQFLVQGPPPLLYLEDERKDRTTGIAFVLQLIVLIGLVALIIQARR